MERFNMGENEAFDIYDEKSYKKKKSKKLFIIVLVLTVVICLGLLILALVMIVKKDEEKIIEYKNEEIKAEGDFFYEKQNEVAEMQANLLSKKVPYIFFYDLANTEDYSYYRDNSYRIFTDGTYSAEITESESGEYSEDKIIGKINLDAFKAYIEENREVIKDFREIDYLKNDDNFLEKNELMILCDGKYRVIPDDNAIYDDIYSMYIEADKEEIQKYNLSSGTRRDDDYLYDDDEEEVEDDE